jgi:hypothetical protein
LEMAIATGGASTEVEAPGLVVAANGEGFIARLRAMMADETGAIGGGTPRTNIAQNRQFKGAIKAAERELGRILTEDEKQAVHRVISGEGYGCHDMVEEVLGMCGGGL